MLKCQTPMVLFNVGNRSILVTKHFLILCHVRLFQMKGIFVIYPLQLINIISLACDEPPELVNAVTGAGTTTIGSVRHYTCFDGWGMYGSGTVTCQSDTSWSSLDSECFGETVCQFLCCITFTAKLRLTSSLILTIDSVSRNIGYV